MTGRHEAASPGRGEAGRPSTNQADGAPERLLLHLVLRNRPAALERLLGTLRRRRVEVEGMTVERQGAELFQVQLQVEVGGWKVERIRAELAAMTDVAMESASSLRSSGSHSEASGIPNEGDGT